MRLDHVLTLLAEKAASDVYLSANAPILLKVNGQMQAITDHALAPGDPRSMLAEVLTPMQMEELEQQGELNIGLGIAKVGSFRLSAFKQRNTLAAVIRCIPCRLSGSPWTRRKHSQR